MGKRESWLLCFVCLPGVMDCCVAIPLSAMGLSAVCDCDTHLLFLGVSRDEFNNARARRALVDWYLSLFVMCKA